MLFTNVFFFFTCSLGHKERSAHVHFSTLPFQGESRTPVLDPSRQNTRDEATQDTQDHRYVLSRPLIRDDLCPLVRCVHLNHSKVEEGVQPGVCKLVLDVQEVPNRTNAGV